MLLLVPYHGLLFLQNRGDEMLGLDFSLFWLHLWRMGLFFAVSGFLAAMTLGLWGPARQVRQRLKRIAIPLAIAMVTILPLLKLIVIWNFNHNNPGSVNPAYDYTIANLLMWEPHHLWFLSYVLAFNLVAVAVWFVASRGPGLGARADGVFRRVLRSPLLIPILAGLGAIPLWLDGYVDAPGQVASSLIPLPSAFAYYGVFFVFGWMLFRSRDLLAIVEDHPWRRLAVALPAGVFAYLLFSAKIDLPGFVPLAPAILVTGGIAAWTTIFAVWGFFAKFLSGARPWVRYLADASYWIYLIHLPVLVTAQLWLAGRTDLAPAPRLVIATSVALAVSVASYALCVRYSPVGNLLHGKRRRTGRDRISEPPTPTNPQPAQMMPMAAGAGAGASRPAESP